jgi:hypothetical protein
MTIINVSLVAGLFILLADKEVALWQLKNIWMNLILIHGK